MVRHSSLPSRTEMAHLGSIPLLVMSVLTFYVLQGWDGGAQLMYAHLTYAVLG